MLDSIGHTYRVIPLIEIQIRWVQTEMNDLKFARKSYFKYFKTQGFPAKTNNNSAH